MIPETAPTLSARAKGGGGLGTDFDCDGGLIQTVGALCADSHPGSYSGQDAYTGRLIPETSPAVTSKWAKGSGGPSGGPSGDECQNLLAVSAAPSSLEITHALRAERFDASEDGTGRGTPIVPVAFDCKASGQNGFGVGEIAPTLRSMGHKNSNSNGGGQIAVCFDTTQITSPENRCNPQEGDPCHPLAAGSHAPAIAFSGRARGDDGRGYDRPPQIFGENTVGSIDTVKPHCVAFQPRIGRNGRGYSEDSIPALNGADAGATSDMRPCVATSAAVRRLTPRECERLQGFPDDYTRLPKWNGWRPLDESETVDGLIAQDFQVRVNKKTGKAMVNDPDGPRYKALGNSMAVDVIVWIGMRISMVERMVE